VSLLVDELLDSNMRGCSHIQIDGRWYIAKGMNLLGLFPNIDRFKNRVIDAIRVLTGKSFAVHYKEDERLQDELDREKRIATALESKRLQKERLAESDDDFDEELE